MPEPGNFLEKLSPNDANYAVAKDLYHKAWSDSHRLVAEALAGRASLSDFVNGSVRTFEQGALTHIAIKDETSAAARCRALDDMAKKFIRKATAVLTKEGKRLGKRKTRTAIADFSRRVLEISARSKQQIHEEALAEITGLGQTMPELSSDALSGETLPARPVGVARALSESTGFGAITRRSTRAIKLGFASNQVADITVPKMTFEFPAYFPETAQRKVLAARLRAEDALKEKRDGVTDFEIAEGLVCEFILEVFKVFVEEGHRLGMQELLTAAQLESECLKFLYSYSVQAGLFDGGFIARVVTEVPGDIPTRIERSEQCRRYRQLLQEVADAQAADEPDQPNSAETLPKEPRDTIDFEGEGWLRVPHADWHKDSAYSMKPPPLLRPVKAARLDAIAVLRKQAAAAVQGALPQTKQQAELSLWPVFSKYAEEVFDKMAEAKLGAAGPGSRPKVYGRWLRSKCLPGVVDDICGPIYGQFPITIRNVVEIIGERESPQIDITRRVLWGILTEVIDGPFTQNLKNCLSAHLEGPVAHWEARVVEQQVSGTANGTKPRHSRDAVDSRPPRRTPDIQSSRDRVQLVNALARELAIVKQETKGYCTVEGLKRKHPKFTLWTLIEDSQIKELVEGEAFTPKAYAESLTLAKYGLTSRETLKKDRRKLRNAKANRKL
jgi:hypothetical protein